MNNSALILWAGIFSVSLLHGFAQLQPPAAAQGGYVEGELLVKFKGGPRGAPASRVRQTMKHEPKRHFDFIGWQQIRLPAGLSVAAAVEQYKNLPDVLAVEPNFVHTRVTGSVPNDFFFAQQYALEGIAASSAWNLTTGSSNVVVAVLDTGINYNHEDLSANMWRNPGEIPGNGIDDDGNGFVDDVYGIDTADDAFGNDSDPMDKGANGFFHGTACAGIIGAVGNNNKGVAGLNWSVRLMAVRFLKLNDTINNADLVDALNYVVLMKQRGVNIRVVSMSFVTSGSQAQKDAHETVAAQGIVQVTGAHNNARDIDVTPWYPAAYNTSNLITVAASTPGDDLASFSNYGRTNVDLAAPGAGVLTVEGSGTNSYVSFSGTSAACPHVAGTAALIAAAHPLLTARQIKAVILESVDVLPAFTNRMVTGGRLNVARAMYHSNFVNSMPPLLVSEPRAQTVAWSNAALLSVSAAGSEPLSYQWQRDGVNLNLAEATNATLAFVAVTTADAGNYRVLVTNSFGCATSAVAPLRVDFSVSFTKITNSVIVMDAGDAVAGSWADYDGDGYADLFVAKSQGQNNALFRNNGNGDFIKITSGPLVTDGGNSWEGAWGDYDRDGDLDLFVANASEQANSLYRNDGAGTFTKASAAQAGSLVADGGSSFNCAWADYDNDGWLDLFVSNGGDQTNQNNFLYHNNGDGTFTRVISGSIVNDGGNSLGAAWADFDNDGFVDLFVANFNGQRNFLYRNNGDGTFAKVTNSPIVLDSGASFTTGSWGDYDNDGDLDLFVSAQGNSVLYRNDGGGLFRPVVAGNLGTDFGASDSGAWGDYDNDGFLDLFVANEQSKAHFLYRNNGDGTFTRIIASIFDYENGSALGCSWVDYNNDGFLDLFVSGLSGAKNHLFRNNGNTNHWLTIKLLGTRSNRNGIGAKIRVRAVIRGTSHGQMREISGGGGWGAHNDVRAAFGLGDATSVDVVRIEWPSGTVQELHNFVVNQFVTLIEPGLDITQPRDAVVKLGGTTNFSVTAFSDQPVLSYQWRFNGTNLPGQTSATLTLTNVQSVQEGDYAAIVVDSLRSATSAVARLTVLVTPAIVQAPISQSVVQGGNATFSVAVTGHPAPFGYQWRRGASILGFLVRQESNCFFTLTNIQPSQGGPGVTYRVIVTNAASTSLTINATFTLTVLSDTNGNGLPDEWEAAFGVTDPALDPDHDGLSNLQEYIAGTDPTNALSYLRVEAIGLTNNATAARLTFLAVASKTYTVESRGTADTGAWTRTADVAATGTNRVVEIIDTTSTPADIQRYYRLVTPRRP